MTETEVKTSTEVTVADSKAPTDSKTPAGPVNPALPPQKIATTMEEKMAEALFIAVGNNQIAAVEKLLSKGAGTGWMHGKHTPLRLAAQRGFFPIVRMLHEKAGVSIKDDKRILHVTVLGETPSKTMLDYLVTKGADVNCEDPTLGTPLMSALSKGKDSKAANWLIELGAKKGGATDLPPLHRAVKKNNVQKARSLLEDGGKELLDSQDKHGMIPLMTAAEKGYNDLINLFINEYGASPNDESSGFSPLFLAVQNNHLSTAKILIEAKADTNAVSKTNKGASPIHLASSNAYLEIMELLFKHGADPNVACKESGLTPMHMAVSEGLTSTVKLLVDNKADVHQKDGEGRSPLLHAVMANHPWTAVVLAQAGADPNAPDNNGMNPIDVVKEHSLGHMANAFTRCGEIDVNDKKTACGACMGAMEQIKRCSRCKQLWYCSLDCQKRHWSHHKTTCVPAPKPV